MTPEEREIHARLDARLRRIGAQRATETEAERRWREEAPEREEQERNRVLARAAEDAAERQHTSSWEEMIERNGGNDGMIGRW